MFLRCVDQPFRTPSLPPNYLSPSKAKGARYEKDMRHTTRLKCFRQIVRTVHFPLSLFHANIGRAFGAILIAESHRIGAQSRITYVFDLIYSEY